MGVSASIIGGGSLLGSAVSTYYGLEAADDASDAYSEATESSNETQLQMLQMILDQQAPWTEAGEAALAKLLGSGYSTGDYSGGLLTEGPGEYEESDYNKYLTEQGLQATENYLASRGLTNTGVAGKALSESAENQAMAGYSEWLDDYYDSLNPWLSIAGLGQTATDTTSSATSSASDTISSNYLYEGSGRASSYIDSSNALTGGIESGLNSLLSAYGASLYG